MFALALSFSVVTSISGVGEDVYRSGQIRMFRLINLASKPLHDDFVIWDGFGLENKKIKNQKFVSRSRSPDSGHRTEDRHCHLPHPNRNGALLHTPVHHPARCTLEGRGVWVEGGEDFRGFLV